VLQVDVLVEVRAVADECSAFESGHLVLAEALFLPDSFRSCAKTSLRVAFQGELVKAAEDFDHPPKQAYVGAAEAPY